MTDRFTVQDKQYMELNPVSERQRREVTGFASGRIESEMKQSFMEVEMVMKKKWMVLMTLTMSLTAASAAWAGVFDNYVDYQNPDGTYSYYFDQGVLVTLDENWYQNTIVKTSDRGATFYQKASYDAYEKEGMEGGRLFTIGASVNSSFSELPSFEYIGFDEDSCMNYYAELPTDYQAYMGDASIQAEYDALWSQVKDVIAGIRMLHNREENIMAHVLVNFRLDEEDKQGMEAVCRELGMSMSAAFTIFAKKMRREKRIPFEVSVDPFYSDENMSYLKEVISDIDAGKANLAEHELIED
jgi:DNA-damage-inducible protein J